MFVRGCITMLFAKYKMYTSKKLVTCVVARLATPKIHLYLNSYPSATAECRPTAQGVDFHVLSQISPTGV